jgi:hypothetical protein
MRTTVKVLVFSLATAALVGPAAAGATGGMGGAGGGGGVVLPQGGGGPPMGGGAPQSGNAPHSAAAPKSNFAQQGAPVGGRTGVGDIWRRHRPWPGGQIVSGGYVYTGGDYDYDETDVNHCLVYRKAYNGAHQFIGWTRVNICTG